MNDRILPPLRSEKSCDFQFAPLISRIPAFRLLICSVAFAFTIGSTCGELVTKTGAWVLANTGIKTMKPESAKRIIDAYFDVFEDLSLKTFNQGLAFVLQGLEERLNSLRSIRTREALLAKLLKEPEPEPFELDAQIEAIHLLPYTIRKVMPEAMHELKHRLPQDPGGRPRGLNGDEPRQVCEEIGKLVARGVRVMDAQNRVAQGKGVSVRTVQRAWQERARFAAEAEK
jgi:hypothetical protein